MPHKSVKSIQDLIYWEYAKLISGSAVGNRKNWGFIMDKYKDLKAKKIKPSQILRENKMLVECENYCAYCGATEGLEWEHIIPLSKGGSNDIDNQVQACRKCNASKGAKGLYEYYGIEKRYELPRIVLGKYLKLAFDHHEQAGTLDSSDLNGDGLLNVLDIDAIFKEIDELEENKSNNS